MAETKPDQIEQPQHRLGSPFPGYNYGVQRLGGQAYRNGWTLSANPYTPNDVGNYASWRYGWFIEQRLYEEAKQREPDRSRVFFEHFTWASIIFIIGGIVGYALTVSGVLS